MDFVNSVINYISAQLESLFKNILQTRKLITNMSFNGKMQLELFTTSKNFTLNMSKETLLKVCNDNPLKAIQEKDDRIKELEFIQDSNSSIVVAKERTKQVEIREREKTEQDRIRLEQIKVEKEKEQIEKEKEQIKLEQIKEKIKLRELLYIKKKDTDSDDDSDSDNEDNNADIYLQFLNECTEQSEKHVHCSILYDTFKTWFKDKNQDAKVPSNKEFVKRLRKHKIIKDVRVEDKVKLGITNLSLK
jgi:hypothetical protein